MFKKSYTCIFYTVAIAGIFSCHPETRITSYQNSYYHLNKELASAEDTSFTSFIRPYKTVVDKEMNVVLGYSELPLVKELPEGTLCNFVADLVLKKANERYKPADGLAADFCILNYGGLRSSLPQGEITKGKVFELMPFENEIVIVTLDGPGTQKLLNHIGEKGGVPLSGIRIGLKEKIPVEINIGEKKFDDTKTYKIVTADYLAGGGDKMDFFKGGKIEYLNYKIRDAIIDHISEENKNGKKITAKVDGRIYYVK